MWWNIECGCAGRFDSVLGVNVIRYFIQYPGLFNVRIDILVES